MRCGRQHNAAPKKKKGEPLFVKIKSLIKALKIAFSTPLPLKCAVRIFRTSATSSHSFLSPLFSHFLLSFTSLIFFNNSLLYNYVLAIFCLQHIERRLRFFVQQIYLFDKMKYNKAKQNRILQASPLKCAVRIFRMSKHCERMRAENVNFCGKDERETLTLFRKKRENHASSNRSRGAGERSRDEIKSVHRRKVDCEWRGCL